MLYSSRKRCMDGRAGKRADVDALMRMAKVFGFRIRRSDFATGEWGFCAGHSRQQQRSCKDAGGHESSHFHRRIPFYFES